MKIAIFDGSFKTTPFITRLVLGLSSKHKVYILGFSNSVDVKLPKVSYVDLGSSQKTTHLLKVSFVESMKLLFYKGKIAPIFSSIKNSIKANKKGLQQGNFNSALTRIQPDVLHVQWPSLLQWCDFISENEKIKIVLSQRGFQSNVRPFVDPDNFQHLKNWYPKIAGFHSVSKAVSEEGNKIYNAPSKIDEVVYSGFYFGALDFSQEFVKKDTLELLSIGRPHWIKGYKDALVACRLLKNKNILFSYTIVGGASNEELQYVIHDLGLQNEVKLIPRMHQKEVYSMMKGSSVLLFPSIMEGMPNVVIEAMAIGLPVIATRCGGIEEVLNDETGWIVEARNPKLLARAIIEFSEASEETIYGIRKKAREKVESQHTTAQMISGMEALYLRCIDPKKNEK